MFCANTAKNVGTCTFFQRHSAQSLKHTVLFLSCHFGKYLQDFDTQSLSCTGSVYRQIISPLTSKSSLALIDHREGLLIIYTMVHKREEERKENLYM
jgi:hypothetical protein